ncbi:MAG: ATP-binding protein [Chloroflexota bacterium]|nr:ATP-binding protein [Chloroflexota bacterium]
MSVKRLIARGSGPMLDFMPEPSVDEVAETIVALTNGVGGMIVVGMDEDGRIYPDAAEYLEPILSRALEMCEPHFRAEDLPEWHSEDTPQGKVVTITVKPTSRLFSVEGRDVFVRSGALNVRLSQEQISRSQRRPRVPFEDDVVLGAAQDDFDEAVIDEYRRNRLNRGPRSESFTRYDLLRDVGAIDPEGAPTVAGMLLFGKNPQHFFPQVGIVVVRFRGTSIRESATTPDRYSRRVEIVGPAPRMVRNAWDLLREELQRQPHMEGLERHESYEYPMEAVREAVVNAVCHRDYGITGQRIEIRLFDDRMEVISPGGLPGHITLDNLLEEHYSRNPRLVRGLYYWGYIEELGQGIDIIYDVMRRDHHPPPEFRDTTRSFTVTLRNTVDQVELQFGDQLNSRQIEALRYLRDHERINNRRYRELCPDVSSETVRLDLSDMVDKGILLKIGAKRGTYYVRK